MKLSSFCSCLKLAQSKMSAETSERMATTSVSGEKGSKGQCSNTEVQGLQLLPEIPNAITLNHICTKLPWITLYTLSSLSPAWREAIQSRSVYETRVRSSSTDTVVVHNHYRDGGDAYQAVALYSTIDKICFELPAIPWSQEVERGIPWSCACVALEGQIYVLGGAKEYDPEEDYQWQARSMVARMHDEDEEKVVYKDVFMWDLVGQRQWQRCASMLEGRHRFACGVMDGKIYVFGGAGPSGPVHGSEVYDPKVNAWSPIKPMPSLRCWGHRVATLGEELCVYGGTFYDAEAAREAEKHPYNSHEWVGYDFMEEALNLEVYHPVKDEWKVVEPFLPEILMKPTIFEARGNLYFMNKQGISVFVSEEKVWKVLCKNLFAAIGPSKSTTVVPCATAAAKDVVYAGVGWYPDGDRREGGMCLLEGRGFDGTKKKIAWRILSSCSCDFEDAMYTMEL